MKYMYQLILLGLFQVAHGETAPYVSPNNFSEWLDYEELGHKLKDISPEQYPIVIEAGPLAGDGVVFRMLLKKKPDNTFMYKFVYGVNKDNFEVQNSEFSQRGFTLIHHQDIQLMAGKIHQAVWVKNDL